MQMELHESGKQQQTSEIPLILAVEDNEDNLVLISYILESLGCKLIVQRERDWMGFESALFACRIEQ